MRKAFVPVQRNATAQLRMAALATDEVHDEEVVHQGDEDAHWGGFEFLVSCHLNDHPYFDEIGVVELAHGFAGHEVCHTDVDLHPFADDK